MIFSINQNKDWRGKGYILRPGLIDLTQNSYLEQDIDLPSGRYNAKVIGSAQSGNGLFEINLLSNNISIYQKKIILKNKNNSEFTFSFDIVNPNRYTLKISRPKESIGRIAINLFNIYLLSPVKNNDPVFSKEKNYFILDYDALSDNNDILNIINYFANKDYDFLLKSSSFNLISSGSKNIRMFFDFDDLFDFISISEFSNLTIFEDNIDSNIVDSYNLYQYNLIKIKKENFYKNKISGILF